ncbi:MAG: protein kinase [Planctomycetes bacterium]|nr:protein kinase [Planctomycetota bacterium]
MTPPSPGWNSLGEGSAAGFPSDLGLSGRSSATPSEGVVSGLNPAFIPGYELLEQLGKGGMGAVFKARQTSLDRLVAIKILGPDLSHDPEFVQRFMIEARTAGKLRHLNIVSAVDCGEAAKLHYIVMELVEGKPLDKTLKERGRLDERVALEIIKQVAEGLDYAWKHGIIHRDIKPQNIMTTAEGVAKICDLGLCKSVQRDPKLTSTGFVYCTPQYASPEQARGVRELDCRTDIFSLGVTFYQLVAGRMPFDAVGPGDYLLKYSNETPPPPSESNPKVSRAVDDLILRMMASEPARRPAYPGAVVDEIRKILASPYAEARAREAAPDRKPAKAPAPARDLLEIAGIPARELVDINIRLRDQCAIVELSGRLDDAFEMQLTKVLTGIADQGVGSIVVDLSRLQYLNSRGVSVFIAVADILRERNGDLKLAAAKPQALVVLERLGITLILQHLPSVAEAIDAFRTPASAQPVPTEIRAPVVEVLPQPLPPVQPAPPPAREERPSGAAASPNRLMVALMVALALLGFVTATLVILLMSRTPPLPSLLGNTEEILSAGKLKAAGPSTTFQLRELRPGAPYWLSTEKVLRRRTLDNWVQAEFSVRAETTYTAWAYLGTTGSDLLGFYQTTEGTANSAPIEPGTENASQLPVRVMGTPRVEAGLNWGWVQIPLPKYYFNAGRKILRISTDQTGFAVRYVLISSNSRLIPNDTVLRELELPPK